MKKLFFYFVLFIGFFVFIYTFYKSEIIWEWKKREYYIDFYYLSFFFVIISFLFNILNKKLKVYFIILFLSTIFSLYIFEFYYLLGDLETSQKKTYTKTLTKLETYNELKKKNKKVSFSLGPNYFLNSDKFEIFPFSGKANSIIINCNESGFFSTYQSDRYGFNNSDNIWEKEFVDFILVGDSYLEGACVNRPNDINSILNLTSKKNFLNLAHGGNGPLVSYSVLREYSKNLRFNNLIYFFSEGNDLENLELEIKNKFLLNYLNKKKYSQNLLEKSHIIDKISDTIVNTEINDLLKRNKKLKEEINIKDNFYENFGSKKFKILRALKLYYTRSMLFKDKYDLVYKPLKINREIEFRFKNVISLMKKFSDEKNVNFYIAYLPTWMRYEGFREFDDRYFLLKKITSELEINFIDLHKDVFEKIDNPNKYFVYGGNSHYNEKGYKAVSKHILQEIAK